MKDWTQDNYTIQDRKPRSDGYIHLVKTHDTLNGDSYYIDGQDCTYGEGKRLYEYYMEGAPITPKRYLGVGCSNLEYPRGWVVAKGFDIINWYDKELSREEIEALYRENIDED